MISDNHAGGATVPRAWCSSSDAGEITDKGYLDQRAILDRRGDKVVELYAGPSVIMAR
jgi:hypothetical protein